MSDLRQVVGDTPQDVGRVRRSHRGVVEAYETKHGTGSWAKRIVCLPKLPEAEMLKLIENKLGEYARREARWDGYSALPASADSLRDARIFIGRRPVGLRLPYPGLDTQGEVSFTWQYGNVCSDVVLEGNGSFYYFARYHEKDGSENLLMGESCRVDSEWPEDLVDVLRRID